MLNKYIKSDIKDGINSLKIGIHNLINELRNNKCKSYEISCNNRFIIVGILMELRMITAHSDDGLIILTNPNINIKFTKDSTIFFIDEKYFDNIEFTSPD